MSRAPPGPSLEDDLRARGVEELAVLPAPLCEICGQPFNPNVYDQRCGGTPCLVPENEIIDWVVRVRGQPSVASPLGRWPAAGASDLLVDSALRLGEIAAELARDVGARLVPQVGPYCPSYLRQLGPLQLSPRELELLQRAWHLPGSIGRRPNELVELDAVWARVAKHLLETVCHRLQEEFR